MENKKINIEIEDTEKEIDSEEQNKNSSSEKCSNETVRQKDDDYLEQLQRLQADFINYKRRTEKEWAEISSTAKGELISNLLPVLDDFKRMINHNNENNFIEIDGVKLIYKKFNKILADEGLEEIPAVGCEFDPEIHEVVVTEETDQDKDSIVLEEWQTGYRFRGKLLRPSKVKVGKYRDNRNE